MKYGCCVEDLNGEEPCVLDPNQSDYSAHDCIYAEDLVARGQFKEDCSYWGPCKDVVPELGACEVAQGRIEELLAENKKLGDQVARLQHSTGACEMIRKEQMIERLVELISKAIPLYWVVADDMDLAAEWEIEANKLLTEVAR